MSSSIEPGDAAARGRAWDPAARAGSRPAPTLPPSPSLSPTTLERHPVGILFVHGIGQQRRGETLVEFGEPLHRWLDEWLRGTSAAWIRNGLDSLTLDTWVEKHEAGWNRLAPDDAMRCVRIARVVREHADAAEVEGAPFADVARRSGTDVLAGQAEVLDAAPAAGDDAAPRHATLLLSQLRAHGDLGNSSWLLAESFWAESFAAPTYGALANWGVQVLPVTLACHYGTRMRRTWQKRRSGSLRGPRRVVSLLFRISVFIGGLAWGLAVMTVLMVISPLGLVPLRPVRALLKSLQQLLAATLGDSYVVCSSPMQAAAIVGQVRRDMEWLAARCRSVLVVAHSQGAAVAFEAIRRGAPANVERFVSFGSGLRKLQELRQTLEGTTRYRRAGLLGLGGLALALAGLGSIAAEAAPWLVGIRLVLPPPWNVLVLNAGLIALAAGIAASWRPFDLPDVKLWGESLCPRGLEWEDYYAHGDPVPNGPLFDEEDQARFVRSSEVHNRASMLSDHTSYWSNREQFVSRVAHLAAMGTDFPLDRLTPKDGELLAVARLRRHWRVGMLRIGRWLTWGSAVAMLGFGSDAMHALGGWTEATVGAAGRWVLSLVGIQANVGDWFAAVTLGRVAALAIVAVVYRLLVTRAWAQWDSHEGDLLARRLSLQAAEGWMFLYLATVLAVSTAYVAVIWLGIATLRDGGNWVIVLGSMALLALGAFLVARWRWSRVKPSREELRYVSPYGVKRRPRARGRAQREDEIRPKAAPGTGRS